MTSQRLLNIQLEWKEPYFLMSAFNTQHKMLAPEYWVPLLFTWHEASYFGTMLDIEKGCVILSPLTAFDYFSGDKASSLFQYAWLGDGKALQKSAPVIYEKIHSEQFSPDFHHCKNDELHWKLADTEFNECISLAIDEYIESNSELKTKKAKIKKTIQHHQHLLVLDEQDWLERIGWTTDETPFSVGISLQEPEADDLPWELNVIFFDKKKPSIIHDTLPAKWGKFESKVSREQELWKQVTPMLFKKDKLKLQLTEQEAWNFLIEDSMKLAESGVDILLPAWWEEIKNMNPALKMKVKSTSNSTRSFVGLDTLMQYDWRIATHDIDISEEEFLSLVEQKRRLIKVNGKWIKLDPEFIKKVKEIFSKVNKTGVPFYELLESEMLEKRGSEDEELKLLAGVQIELNRDLKKMIKQLNQINAIPKITIPSNFQGELRPYQKQGVEWLLFMRQFGFGACLADDMGLGKTIQMITYFLQVNVKEKVKQPALIVCPTSVLGNWQKEIERFAPSLSVVLHYGSNRGKEDTFAESIKASDIVITSYALAHLDETELTSINWSTVCLDEAQNIKNAYTKQSRSIRKLNADHKIALTGTPIENRLTELWSIFDFINHGYLGSLIGFKRRFVNPIEKDENKQKMIQLQRLVRPFLLRRTKQDEEVNLNLPDKQEQKEYCSLTVEQASLYEQLVKDTFEQMATLTGIERRGHILSMLLKLKQLCNHPALYLKEPYNAKNFIDRSYKAEKLIELIDSIQEQAESCLIFTQYIDMGKMMKDYLQTHTKQDVLFLHGGLNKDARDRMIDKFQNGDAKILILSLKAGGTGLNLTAANHVIHYDRWWNPAVENQATDRAYRIGQKRFVHVHKFITTGTLEEKIDDMIEKKQALSDDIISGENWITELSTDELKDLFSLRQKWKD